MDLANKTAMITGAVGNLGTAVSTALKAAGAKTIVVDRSQERLEQVYKSGPECLLAGNADLTSEGSVGKVVASALKHFGRIDALINTVGGFRGGKAVHEEDLSTWDDDDGQSADNGSHVSRGHPGNARERGRLDRECLGRRRTLRAAGARRL